MCKIAYCNPTSVSKILSAKNKYGVRTHIKKRLTQKGSFGVKSEKQKK